MQTCVSGLGKVRQCFGMAATASAVLAFELMPHGLGCRVEP